MVSVNADWWQVPVSTAKLLLGSALNVHPYVVIGALAGLGLTAGAIVFAFRHMQRNKVEELKAELNRFQQQAARLECERNSAQEALFRRSCEERELTRERGQFQEQLAQYEKY